MKFAVLGMLVTFTCLVQLPGSQPVFRRRRVSLALALGYAVGITAFSYGMGVGLALLPHLLFEHPGWAEVLAIDGLFLGVVLAVVASLVRRSRHRKRARAEALAGREPGQDTTTPVRR